MTKEALVKDVIKMAEAAGWVHLKTQDWCVNFYKNFKEDRCTINVYWNASMVAFINERPPLFTVQTAINHPKRGKTQLNRRGVSLDWLDRIFANPRTHTGKGYYKK